MHDTADIVTGVVSLLLIAAVILAITKRFKLPFTVILVLVGILIAQLASLYPDELAPLRQIHISPALILYVFLPTLIFESALNLDTRQLRHNLAPILLLAIPGLLISTLIIGLIVTTLTAIPLAPALLLGAILSATDPVAVIAIFKKLGAPQRLTILVEGESLFNDATAIVVARMLIAVIVAGSATLETAMSGLVDIFILFIGGFVTGWGLGVITGYLLGAIESDRYLEITLTTILAYVSFLIAEDLLHVSGVMATVGAGLVMGSWGRVKISPSVRAYLHHFWEYMAFIANALIFLIVGLTIDLSAVWQSLDLLVWVILAMLVARATIVYGLMPITGRLTASEPISLPYQSVIFWGGLRGAIALAIVLSFPDFEYSETFIALVTGAVMFTLLIQGLSIQSLVKWLGLSKISAADRLVQIEVSIEGKIEAKRRVQDMANSGVFSNKVTLRLHNECESQIQALKKDFEDITVHQLSTQKNLNLLYLRLLVEEKNKYTDMLSRGHISEASFRDQELILSQQIDAVRYHGQFERIPGYKIKRRIQDTLYRLMGKVPWLSHTSERLKLNRVGRDYEMAWGHYMASAYILDYLTHFCELDAMRPEVIEQVTAKYTKWHTQAAAQLDHFAEQFPEFVTATQERMCRRLAINAEDENTSLQAEHGTLPGGLVDEMHSDLLQRLRELRGLEVAKLKVSPEALLKQAPYFNALSDAELQQISQDMLHSVYSEGDIIIHQGDGGHALYLLARGVVRIARDENKSCRNLATLMAGDIFGEMALLENKPHSASAHAVTPCTLFEIPLATLEPIIKSHPEIRNALILIDEQRGAS